MLHPIDLEILQCKFGVFSSPYQKLYEEQLITVNKS